MEAKATESRHRHKQELIILDSLSAKNLAFANRCYRITQGSEDIQMRKVAGPFWWGVATRWLGWFDILFGWFASLMFVAIAGRLVERD